MEDTERYTISAKADDMNIIDKAAKRDNRSRSSYLITAGLEKAKNLGVENDAIKSE